MMQIAASVHWMRPPIEVRTSNAEVDRLQGQLLEETRCNRVASCTRSLEEAIYRRHKPPQRAPIKIARPMRIS